MSECTWEYDYIRHDLLADIPNIDSEIINGGNISNLLHRQPGQPTIMALTCRTDFTTVLQVVKHIKPLIIFINSDEVGHAMEWQSLQNHTKLLLRQYNHKPYQYEPNNIHIPLGYASGYLHKRTSFEMQPLKATTDRSINCTFIGEQKYDRTHMSNVFKANMEKTNIDFVITNWSDSEKQTYHPSKLFDIYKDTIFIPNGRGNSVNCFRVYEAIIAGAIPVIVGEMADTQHMFTFHNGKIPCVYAENWESAVATCNSLLTQPEKLQDMQTSLIRWYNETIDGIRQLIQKNIQEQ